MTPDRPTARAVVLALIVAAVATSGALGAVGAVAGAAAQTDSPDGGETQIDSCTEITEPGSYVLAEDLTDVNGTCIEIRASDVVLDGNGHTVDGVQNESAIGGFVNASYGVVPEAENQTNASVEPPVPLPWDEQWSNVGVAVNGTERLANVTVRNLTVSEFFFGAYVQDVENATVADVTAEGNGDGFDAYNASSVTVADSTFTGNAWGVGTTNVTDSEVRNVTAVENRETGLYVYATETLTIANASASDNGASGIIIDVSNESTVVDTEANGNRYGGVPLFVSSNNTLTNVTASGNGHDGIAMYLNSTGNLVADSTVANTTGEDDFSAATGFSAGVVVADNATDNRVVNTTAVNNAGWAFYTRNESTNNTVEAFTLADENVTTSFQGVDVAIAPAAESPSPPEGYAGIGKFVNATNLTGNASLFLNVSYDEAALENVDEETLRMWVYRTGEWSELEGVNGVNTEENYVYANVTQFGVVGPLGQVTGADATAGNVTEANATAENATGANATDADATEANATEADVSEADATAGAETVTADASG